MRRVPDRPKNKMSKVQIVRSLINQRLSAAAEEIFELFERTIAEYEEQLCRSKEENERQKKLLETVYKPEIRLHRADVQQLLVSPENVPGEKQKRGLSLDQEDPPEPAHIKEEQEDLWSHQETEQLHGLKETTELLMTPVPAKTEEEEEEEPQSSQLHENQTEEMLDSESETDDSSFYQEQLTAVSFSECATSSDQKEPEQDAGKIQNNKKTFICPVCGKILTTRGNLNQHMCCHSSEKPYICSICGKRFLQKRYLQQHMVYHSGEKPYSCLQCGKRFLKPSQLKDHETIHTGEKPYSCNVCGKSFVLKRYVKEHMICHSAEKPYSCSQCGKRFLKSSRLKEHLTVHTGAQSHICPVCGKIFLQLRYLKDHMISHSAEKPYSCSLCGKGFLKPSHLKKHVTIHTRQKLYHCSICDKSFAQPEVFENHTCEAESSRNEMNETTIPVESTKTSRVVDFSVSF